jgi:hypothetical protein
MEVEVVVLNWRVFIKFYPAGSIHLAQASTRDTPLVRFKTLVSIHKPSWLFSLYLCTKALWQKLVFA